MRAEEIALFVILVALVRGCGKRTAYLCPSFATGVTIAAWPADIRHDGDIVDWVIGTYFSESNDNRNIKLVNIVNQVESDESPRRSNERATFMQVTTNHIVHMPFMPPSLGSTYLGRD